MVGLERPMDVCVTHSGFSGICYDFIKVTPLGFSVSLIMILKSMILLVLFITMIDGSVLLLSHM